jgi:hypothetical protein
VCGSFSAFLTIQNGGVFHCAKDYMVFSSFQLKDRGMGARGLLLCVHCGAVSRGGGDKVAPAYVLSVM